MKILVTGHHGFIGSNLIKALAKDHEVTGLEIGDPWPKIKGLQWVIHLGGISATTERRVDVVMQNNYDFSVRLLDECYANGVNFQFASSASIYGLGTNFSTDAPPDPRSPYAWSKYLVERYAKQSGYWRKIVVQCLRFFNVYGPGEDHKGNQASPHTQFARQAKERGYIELFAPMGAYKRDFIHVDRVIDFQERFMECPESGTFNVGTGNATSFLEVAQQVCDDIREVPMPEALRSQYQAFTCADMSKTNSILEGLSWTTKPTS